MLIAGGGVGGIETALALKDLAEGRVEVDIYEPRPEFVYRPFAIGEPYGALRAFRYDVRGLCDRSAASFHAGDIVSVDPERRLAFTRDGERLSYDFLVVATGARMLWSVPGAVTFWGVADEGQAGEVIADLRSGALRHAVFTMPAGYSWTLPLYELALLAVTVREKSGRSETRVTVVTPEDAPLEAFGRNVSEQMGAMLAERDVELIGGTRPVKFEHGRLRVIPGEEIEADAVMALPRFVGRRVGGIPHNEHGFVDVDETCAVSGLDRVYAVGDVTAFPVKQGGLTTQQADCAAEAIAAAAGADVRPRPFDRILRGVLWTGHRPRYLYGRANGEGGEASSFSDRPRGPLSDGKVTARYLTPLVDAIEAEADRHNGSDQDPVEPLRARSVH